MSRDATTAERARLAEEAIAQHNNGTLHLHLHWSRRLAYTDGVRALANAAGAHWLIDIIASHQMSRKAAQAPFQVWTLTLTPHLKDFAARVEMGEDRTEGGKMLHWQFGNGNGACIERPAIVQRIGYTDFPLDTVTLYVEGGATPRAPRTLMLPSER
jgi:hypothetical protein